MKIIARKGLFSEDTRRARRFQSFCLMRYVLSSKERQMTVMVNPRNISAYGALFASEQRLPLNAILETEIYLPPLKDFITTMASVRRVQKIRDREQYWIGVYFSAMDPLERKRIDSYISGMEKYPFMQRYLDRKPRFVTRSLP